jgi:type II secretory pathway pseudopilin PulG
MAREWNARRALVGTGKGRHARRGVMLLEVVLALALVVVVGLVVLSAVSQSTGALRAAREKQVAVDLARSAMAKLEAGIETTTTLSGPVQAWSEDMNLAEVPQDGDETGWELAVESEPSSFDGLTYVTVTARRASVDGWAGASGAASGNAGFTLRQLVRLAERDEDGIGEKDDVTVEAEKARERFPSRRNEDRESDDRGRP